MSTPEVACFAFRKVFPFLMPHEHHFEVVEMGQASDDCLVVAKRAVAVKLKELLEDQIKIIAGLRALLVPRYLDNLPGIKIGVNLAFQPGQLAAETANLFGDFGRITAGAVLGVLRLHLAETRFHIVDGCLE
jgi:hypothetical protein